MDFVPYSMFGCRNQSLQRNKFGGRNQNLVDIFGGNDHLVLFIVHITKYYIGLLLLIKFL